MRPVRLSFSPRTQFLLPSLRRSLPFKAQASPRFRWSRRNQTTQTADSQLYLADFPKNLNKAYRPEYIRFYENHIGGKLRYGFSKASQSRGYPCKEDYVRTSSLARDVNCHDVWLPRKATGNILLRIYESAHTTSESPVVLYFPSRGTSPISATAEHDLIAYLTSLLCSTTIVVGYRISPPFPTSLHDCLAAVDWVRSNIPTVKLEDYAERFQGRLLATLGAGIGGGLAASIGITEGRESGIIATGAWTPIVDWGFDPLPGIPSSDLSTLPKSPAELQGRLSEWGEYRPYHEIDRDVLLQIGLTENVLSEYNDIADNPFLSTADLAALRARYICTAEDFVDPFVSPLYWFKSSGVNIWTRVLSMINDEMFADPYNPPKWIENMPDEVFHRGYRKTKAYPPLDFAANLTIPMMRIVSAGSDILSAQTSEFVTAARTSIFPIKPKTPSERKREEEGEIVPKYDDQAGRWVMGEINPAMNADWKMPEEGAEYKPAAEKYIAHEIIDKAGHCMITAPPAEIGDGIKEVEKMAAWLERVFEGEPARSSQWRIMMENRQRKVEKARLRKLRKRLQ
ncbi:hypothetical protein ABW19_dt0208189 [Dactylella cylindrospora]|nr:hypothetical protein ABW19_dt0208189 [Dactylella cylindrospora]